MSPAKPPRIAGVILAAGTSSRMGTPKQLLPYNETTILGEVLKNARRSALDPVTLVLGFMADEIRHQVDLGTATVVIAEAYAQGQSASLKAGLSVVPADCDGALFLLGDQPLITAELINTLIAAYRPSKSNILIPTWRGKRGTPVLIGRPLFAHLSALTGDTGARALFEKFADAITEIEVDRESVRIDIDTPQDYEKLCPANTRKFVDHQ
jgi:molybdenum cofactor cytidylyltransferase